MSVSLFSVLLDSQSSSSSSSEFTAVEAEKAVSGNLCRCTGYRPIVDACKSFASDVDIEDLGFNSFCKKTSLPRFDSEDRVCTFPEFLKEDESKSIDSGTALRWCSPASVEELRIILKVCKANGDHVVLVAGNTSTGYYKDEKERDYDNKYVDLTRIAEMRNIRESHDRVEIGAAATISKVIAALKEINNKHKMFGKLASHMEKIAARFVRNSASVGGNLVIAQRKGFPSDMATILLAAGASVNIMSSSSRGGGCEKVTLEQFLQGPPLDAYDLVLSIEIPFWHRRREANSGELVFETYRASPRPQGSALAYLNAAFLAEVKDDKKVISCRLAFGAFGAFGAYELTPNGVRKLRISSPVK